MAKSVKLSHSQHEALRNAIEHVVEHLADGTIEEKLLSANLSGLLIKLNKQAVERKPQYNLKMSVEQELAFLIVGLRGMFDIDQYTLMTTDRINHNLLRIHA